MAYIGNTPAESFASFEKQVFTIVNSQTAYTLSHSVVNENDIRLVVNNVVQEPGSGKAYTASGTTLTLSAALVNGTDEMYCVFLGRALQTVNAPNASVGLSQLSATGTKDATTFLRGDNTFASAGGDNTPAFMVSLSASQTLSHNTTTKITLDREIVDTDNAFASNKFTVPSGEAGKYYIQFSTLAYDGTGVLKLSRPMIYKNGSMVAERIQDPTQNFYNISDTLSIILDLSVSDYIEFYYKGQTGDSGTFIIQGESSDFYTYGFGYKLIGV